MQISSVVPSCERPVREFVGLRRTANKRAPKVVRVFPSTRITLHACTLYMQLLPIHRSEPAKKKETREKSWLAAPSDRGSEACRRMRQTCDSLCIRVDSPTPNCARVQVKTLNIPGPLLLSHASRTRTGKACVTRAHPPPFPCCSSPTAAVAAADVKRNRNRETTT